MSILYGDDSRSDSGDPTKLYFDNYVKSVTFAPPLESTRIDNDSVIFQEQNCECISDFTDQDHHHLLHSRKTIHGIYNSPLGAIAEDNLDIGPCTDSTLDTSPCTDSTLDTSPSTDSTLHRTEHASENVNQSHERPKHKTENKVTFCDIPREIEETEAVPEPEPRQSSPPSITYSEVIIVTDPPPGLWPIKRSVSLESRDNPFQPDGDLSKETEDLLARAVIIRDKFIINDPDSVATGHSGPQNDSATRSPVKTNTDSEKGVVEESLSPSRVNESQCAPGKPRQNGKLEDSSVSPGSVKPEVNSDGSTNPEEKLKDKKKQQQKCCIIM